MSPLSLQRQSSLKALLALCTLVFGLAPDAALADGFLSSLLHQIELKKFIKKTAVAERDQPEKLDANAPLIAPLVGANGAAPTTELRPSDIPPVSLSKTLISLSDEQRTDMLVSMSAEINKLTAELSALLALDTKSEANLKEIEELNNTLSTKRQAYDFTMGKQTVVSNAAAESFATTSNPYFLMCGNALWTRNDPLRWIDMLAPQRNTLIEAGHSVGMVTIKDRPAGTAFVVGKSHIITNLHVLKLIGEYDDMSKSWKILPEVKVKFDVEYPIDDGVTCKAPPTPKSYYVNGVFAVPANGIKDDLAVLLTASDEQYPKPLKVKARPPKQYSSNMVIAIIGYPGPPSDMTAAEQMQFFSTPTAITPQFTYKRLSGGFTGDELVTLDGYFIHKANTAGGNSGSPIFDLKDGDVIGIHVAGSDRYNSVMGYNHGLIGERILKLLSKAGL